MSSPSDIDLGEYVYAGHYALLHHTIPEVVSLYPQRVALEFGVADGQSTRLIAEKMPVIGFDSFRGLPEDWRPGFPAGMFACTPPVIDNAQFVVGLYEDTLKAWDCNQLTPRVGLIHIDCDLYSSTKTVLDNLEFLIGRDRPYIVFDEFHGYDGAERYEQRAWREFAKRTGVQWSVVGHSEQAWSIRVI